jgi:hypothetical protein
MSAPAAVSRPIPARVLDLLLERRFAPFHGVSRRREYAVQFGWINLPIAGLESACPQDRHGQNVVSIASNTWPASWAAPARSRSSGTTIGCGLNDNYYLVSNYSWLSR